MSKPATIMATEYCGLWTTHNKLKYKILTLRLPLIVILVVGEIASNCFLVPYRYPRGEEEEESLLAYL